MTGDEVYDLAFCAPDSPFTAEQLAERIARYSGITVTAEECQRCMDEFWDRIRKARSHHVGTLRLGADR